MTDSNMTDSNMTDSNPYSSSQTCELPIVATAPSSESNTAGLLRAKTSSRCLLWSVIIVAANAIVLSIVQTHLRSTVANTGDWLTPLLTIFPLVVLVVLPSAVLVVTSSAFGAWNGIAAFMHPLPQSAKLLNALYLFCHVVLLATPVGCLV